MASPVIDKIEKAAMKNGLPQIKVGDTVIVSKLITEGKKQRIQKYEGIVVKERGSSVRKSITVRKIFDSVGIEKSFLIHSPLIKEIDVIKKGKVRRAKLYYLRDRIGKKATRIKTKETVKKEPAVKPTEVKKEISKAVKPVVEAVNPVTTSKVVEQDKVLEKEPVAVVKGDS